MGLRQAGLDEFETVFETFFFDFASCLYLVLFYTKVWIAS